MTYKQNGIINNDIFLLKNEITKIASDTKDISIQILNKLDEQGESINKSELNIESSNYLLSKSLRIARYMTWFGWISNLFTKDPKLPQTKNIKTNIKNDIVINENTIINPHVNKQSLVYNNKKNDDVNNAMLEFEKHLTDLKTISILIGEQLDKQNESIERINIKESNLSDKMKSIESYISTI